jgi:hypothetical protein
VSTGKTYRLGRLAQGATVYTDRAYGWTTIPTLFQGAQYVLTANNDKSVTATQYLSFTISGPATVYIAFDNRVITVPAWLANAAWTRIANTLGTTDSPRRVYSRRFGAGTVVLGGNNMAPATWNGMSNYNVIIIPD